MLGPKKVHIGFEGDEPTLILQVLFLQLLKLEWQSRLPLECEPDSRSNWMMYRVAQPRGTVHGSGDGGPAFPSIDLRCAPRFPESLVFGGVLVVLNGREGDPFV